ncbi:MAG: rhodanese-like domain-containing protein, partial [Vicingaceae bacterium]
NEVSVQDVKGKTEILFVDAREENEYKVSHIKDAVFVGYDNLDLSDLERVDRSKEVVVYCSVGYRSEKVAEKLLEMGFSNVSNLYGGLFEWKNQEQVIVNLKNEPTEKIHAFNKVWEIWLKKGEKVY